MDPPESRRPKTCLDGLQARSSFRRGPGESSLRTSIGAICSRVFDRVSKAMIGGPSNFQHLTHMDKSDANRVRGSKVRRLSFYSTVCFSADVAMTGNGRNHCCSTATFRFRGEQGEHRHSISSNPWAAHCAVTTTVLYCNFATHSYRSPAQAVTVFRASCACHGKRKAESTSAGHAEHNQSSWLASRTTIWAGTPITQCNDAKSADKQAINAPGQTRLAASGPSSFSCRSRRAGTGRGQADHDFQ